MSGRADRYAVVLGISRPTATRQHRLGAASERSDAKVLWIASDKDGTSVSPSTAARILALPYDARILLAALPTLASGASGLDRPWRSSRGFASWSRRSL